MFDLAILGGTIIDGTGRDRFTADIAIALVETGDQIAIDIPNRTISLEVGEETLAVRREAIEASGGYQPVDRDRVVSPALRAYAMMATTADTGAVRDVDGVERLMNAARLLDSEQIGT